MNSHLQIVANVNSRDPSRTSSLRRVFSVAMSRRINDLVKIIKTVIVNDDVFGLINPTPSYGIEVLQGMTSPGRRAYSFQRDHAKIANFMKWLQEMVDRGILDIADITQVGESINSAWPNKFIHQAYGKGVAKARSQLKQGGLVVPTISESGGIGAVMGQLIHLDRVGVLYTRAFNELVGITDAMDQLISRLLAEGIVAGHSPTEIAKVLSHAITGQGSTLDLPVSYVNKKTGKVIRYVIPAKERAITLARTEIIRAHAIGQLQEFKNWGVLGVTAKAELRTAGDDRVCELCAGLEGVRYEIEEAMGIIPVHPKCRCIWLPFIGK